VYEIKQNTVLLSTYSFSHR